MPRTLITVPPDCNVHDWSFMMVTLQEWKRGEADESAHSFERELSRQ